MGNGCFFLQLIPCIFGQIIPSTAGETGLLRIVLQWLLLAKTLRRMTKKAPNTKQPTSFEEAMAELKQLVARMEAGELPLDASVAAYQRGAELVKYCALQLDQIEAQVKVLEGDMLKPFTASGVSEV